jgi:hypothetical protein
MGAAGIVIAPPCFNDLPSHWQAPKHELVEAFIAKAAIEALGYRITGGGSVTQEPPFWTRTVPLPFVSVSVAPICRVTAFGYPVGRLVVPVELRDCPAASGTEFSATLKAPSRTVVVAPECVTSNVEPFPVWVVHALNQLESVSSKATSTSGSAVSGGGAPVLGVAGKCRNLTPGEAARRMLR